MSLSPFIFYRINNSENLRCIVLFLIEKGNVSRNIMKRSPYNTRNASSKNGNLRDGTSNQDSKPDLSVFTFQDKPKLYINKTIAELKQRVEQEESEKIKNEVKTRGRKPKLISNTVQDLAQKCETDNEQGFSNLRENIVKPTRGKRKTKKEDTVENNNSLVPNLSDVHASVKQEIEEKTTIKREHIKIEYDPSKRENSDDDSPKKKVKPEIKSELKIPFNWETVLRNLREMRKHFDAPVDSMGCHKSCDESAPPKVSLS